MVTEIKKDYTLHLDHGDHYGQTGNKCPMMNVLSRSLICNHSLLWFTLFKYVSKHLKISGNYNQYI